MSTTTTKVGDFQATRIDGSPSSLDAYDGQVLLIVNTASQCGFTPQYQGLERLYQDYRDRGFQVLAFPCNQFGKQEPGSAEQIAQFCETHFGVSFPVFDKVDVNGEGAHPLFQWLKLQAPGVLGTQGIKWNFTKFLIGRDGRVVRRFAPNVTPDDLRAPIEALL
jgi:glutathione peroxidase